MATVWIQFVIVLLISGLLLAAIAVWLMARVLLAPPRMSDARAIFELRRLSPGDLALPFEDLTFQVRDEVNGGTVKLPAWWIPAQAVSDKTAILVHGYGDAKVGAIAWAHVFRALGYNVLAFDLRGHGEAQGAYTTAGYFERHDLNQVLNQLRAQRGAQTRQVILFGVSLGAAVVVAAVVERNDIDAVVLECPFARYRLAVAAQGRTLGAPGGIMQRLALRLAEYLSGADFEAVAPGDLIPKVPCPIMIIQAGDDHFLTLADVREVQDALASRGNPSDRVWSVAGARHVLALAQDPQDYLDHVEEFLQQVESRKQELSATSKAIGECD